MSFSTLLISSLLTTVIVGKPIHSLQDRATVQVAGYDYVGCYTDSVADRTFTEKTYIDDTMTIEKCAAQCSTYTWFGLEYGREVCCQVFVLHSSSTNTVSASVVIHLKPALPRSKKRIVLPHALAMALRPAEQEII